MLVSQILRTKGDTVFTVSPSETIAVVAALLHSRRVGALVVLDAERVAGIVSERDVVRAMAEGGGSALEKPVSVVMTRDVLFAQRGETVDSLLQKAEGTYAGTSNQREGIVIRPVTPRRSTALGGRLSFKAISNRYLLDERD